MLNEIKIEDMGSNEGKKSSRITIANIVSLVGLLVLLMFSFLGHTYKSGGESGWDLLIPIGITAVIGFLLWFLIKAKGAENDLKKWKILEGVLLAVYLSMAVISFFYSGISNFFNVEFNKKGLKEYAKQDLDKITALFTDYEKFEKDALSRTESGLRNAVRYERSEALDEFITQKIGTTDVSIDTYISDQRDNLLGDYYKEIRDRDTSSVAEIRKAIVDGWNIFKIGKEASKIDGLKEDVEESLTGLSREARLPDISSEGDTYYYVLGDYQTKEYRVSEDLQFNEALQKVNLKVMTLIIEIIIHFIILFNYIVAYRTTTLSPRTDLEDDGGINL